MKNKNKLKYLSLGILLTGALGFSAIAVKQVQVKAESENVVNINRENKKQVSYNDEDYEITLSANELNNYAWNNFINYIDEQQIVSEFEIHSNSLVYDYSNYVDGAFSWEETNQEHTIELVDDNTLFNNANDINIGNYMFCFDREVNNFEHDITLIIGSNNYAEIKTAIELDIQANESNYGESIISAISSGLGLIPDLAGEFLTGFTTLFWDSVNEKLTDFGTFALVFLGVAITMAVVKLCLAILRSNTGA